MVDSSEKLPFKEGFDPHWGFEECATTVALLAFVGSAFLSFVWLAPKVARWSNAVPQNWWRLTVLICVSVLLPLALLLGAVRIYKYLRGYEWRDRQAERIRDRFRDTMASLDSDELETVVAGWNRDYTIKHVSRRRAGDIRIGFPKLECHPVVGGGYIFTCGRKLVVEVGCNADEDRVRALIRGSVRSRGISSPRRRWRWPIPVGRRA